MSESSGHEASESFMDQLLEAWSSLSREERWEKFCSLPREDEDETFLRLSAADQAWILENAGPSQRRAWIRLLAPDDAVDVLQESSEDLRAAWINLLDPQTRYEVRALLAYREDEAGGLMSPRYARLRPDMTVQEAIRYLQAQTRANLETIYYGYVLTPERRLLGVVSLRQLFQAQPNRRVDEIMHRDEDLVTVTDSLDQEQIAHLFSQHEFLALPVVDEWGIMKGIVTVDDVVDVVREEATEDIQKFGAVEVLEAPYFEIGFWSMVRKRAGWLLVLFVGEMFTATAMGYYEREIERAIVLALFIPLIISSGGNAGSQASTLVIRAMALEEVRLKDWLRVFFREVSSGCMLGLILGGMGLLRILLWPRRATLYGEHYFWVSLAVAISVMGVVLWGTLVGAMLPFLLRKLRFDPATASAPFVATVVDVTGLIIYFNVAHWLLSGILL